jgi:hypothetical protein
LKVIMADQHHILVSAAARLELGSTHKRRLAIAAGMIARDIGLSPQNVVAINRCVGAAPGIVMLSERVGAALLRGALTPDVCRERPL